MSAPRNLPIHGSSDAKVRASGRPASNRYRNDLLARFDAMVRTSGANPARGTLLPCTGAAVDRRTSNRYHNDSFATHPGAGSRCAKVQTLRSGPRKELRLPCAGANCAEVQTRRIVPRRETQLGCRTGNFH